MNNALVLLSESENVIDRLQGLDGAKEQLADPDYWSSVGIIALTGILVVFLILAILIFVFWLMGTVFKMMDKSKKAKAKNNAEVVEAKPAPAAEPEAETAEELSDDEEIVAVISAAIAAYTESSFTVRSIRKRGDGRGRSAWSAAGISENTRPF